MSKNRGVAFLGPPRASREPRDNCFSLLFGWGECRI